MSKQRASMVVTHQRVTKVQKHRKRYWYGRYGSLSEAARIRHLLECAECLEWRKRVAEKPLAGVSIRIAFKR